MNRTHDEGWDELIDLATGPVEPDDEDEEEEEFDLGCPDARDYEREPDLVRCTLGGEEFWEPRYEE